MDFATSEVHIFSYDPNVWESGEHFLIAHFSEQGNTFKESQCQWMIVDLEKIKFALSVGNESQAIRFIEQYGFYKQGGYDKTIKEESMKQETPEEAAQKRFPINYNLSIFERTGLNSATNMGFVEGAKWQAERMYSKEEVGEILYNAFGEYGKHYGIMLDGALINKLFEQFKKK